MKKTAERTKRYYINCENPFWLFTEAGVIMGEIQIVQNEFSEVEEVSLWIYNKDHVIVSDMSLTKEFLGDDGKEAVDFIDEFLKGCSDTRNTIEIFIKDKRVLAAKREIKVFDDVIGYCVGFTYRDNDSDIDKDSFDEKMELFLNITVAIYQSYKENERLREELNRVKVAEKNAEQEKERLQHENDFDSLTKVHSRSYFFKLLDRADKDETLLPISLVVGDVNNLKFTNDMFGHRHGDWLLCKIAQILQEEAINEESVIARCGGDEFFIFMPNTKRAGANYYCKRVTERLARENDTCLPPSISLGSAKKSEMSQSLHRLLETADAKMYAVKSEFKQKQNLFEDMLQILYSRKFLTREGIDRKSKMVSDFAATFNWSPQKIQQCVYLARYQDIGLSVVPERIYNKQEEYSDREWREIKKHPQLGMKIALITVETAPISEWMYCTHENYDGSGWPRALKGKELTAEVTLVRLVTEFVEEEERSGSSQAYNYIKEQRGKIFEPQMTDKFLKFLNTYINNLNIN